MLSYCEIYYRLLFENKINISIILLECVCVSICMCAYVRKLFQLFWLECVFKCIYECICICAYVYVMCMHVCICIRVRAYVFVFRSVVILAVLKIVATLYIMTSHSVYVNVIILLIIGTLITLFQFLFSACLIYKLGIVSICMIHMLRFCLYLGLNYPKYY